jgi:hypothetical protein
MPIEGSAGTLDIENATLRSNAIAVLTNLVTGNDRVRESGAPALEVYGDPSNGGNEARLEMVSNTVAVSSSAFTRLTSNAGVLSVKTGTNASDNGTITFGGFANERMRIGSDGKVGIGTDSPVAKLNIQGTSEGAPPSSGGEGTSNGIFRLRDNFNVALDIGTLGASPWTTWLQVADTTSMGSYYPLALQPNGGNVGIGTNNPVATLDVAGNVTNGRSLQLRSGDVATESDSSQIIFSYSNNPYNSGGYAHSIRTRHNSGADNGNAIDFWCWNTTDTTDASTLGNKRVMTIEGNGRVGIGKTNPDTALDVNGVIKQTGASWSYTNYGASGVGTTAGSYAYFNRALASARNVTVTNETNTGTGGETRTRITTTVAGRYAVACNGFKETETLATVLELQLQKNGIYVSHRAYNNIPGDFSPYATAGGHYSIIDMSATDYLEVYISHGDYHGNDSIYFSGHLIG